jgi:hypothetical protein
MKCAFWASTVIAMKLERAITARVRILVRFISLLLIFGLIFVELSLVASDNKRGEIYSSFMAGHSASQWDILRPNRGKIRK